MANIDLIMGKDDNALLAEVGEASLSGDLDLNQPTLDELIRAGRAWMESKKDLLCGIICEHEKIKNVVHSNHLSKDVIALIIDVLELHVAHLSPIPPASAGLLFARLGFHKLCLGHGGSQPKS